MKPIRNIAILGSGAMGGLYASHFCAADFSVYSVASGDRAERLKTHGLYVNDQRVAVEVFDAARARESADILPEMDLIVVAVKHHQLDAALQDVTPFVTEETVFISVLNGLDSEESIAARFASAKVLYCIALAMDAGRDGNRVHFHNAGKLVFGEADNRETSESVARVQAALDRAGLAWETPPDMLRELWWKFMVNVGINQASALLGATYSEFVAAGPARSLMDNLIAEVVQTSQPAGINLDQSDLDRWYRVLANQAENGKTSMLQDIEAGRPTELEIFAGRVIRMGQDYSIDTPFNQAASDILSVWSDTGRRVTSSS